MNLTDMARELGISRQALNKRVNANMGKDGIDLSFVRDPETKQLTEAGIAYIRKLYAARIDAREARDDLLEDIEEQLDEDAQPDATPVAHPLSYAALRAEVSRLEERNRNLEAQLKVQAEESEFLRKMLAQAQEMNAMALQRIPTVPALPDPKERGIRAWWRRRHGSSSSSPEQKE